MEKLPLNLGKDLQQHHLLFIKWSKDPFPTRLLPSIPATSQETGAIILDKETYKCKFEEHKLRIFGVTPTS